VLHGSAVELWNFCKLFRVVTLSVLGLPQDWGSGCDRHWRIWIVGWLESLSEAGPERAIIDGARNLEQQVGPTSRPAHLL